jgi:hypothetical protein
MQRCLRLSVDDPASQFCAALVYTLASEHTSALFYTRQAIELKIAPRWFDLPWFDPIRNQQEFRGLIESAQVLPNMDTDN